MPPLVHVLTTIIWFIGSITAVIHRVTFPPEWDAFISFTTKLKKPKKTENKRAEEPIACNRSWIFKNSPRFLIFFALNMSNELLKGFLDGK